MIYMPKSVWSHLSLWRNDHHQWTHLFIFSAAITYFVVAIVKNIPIKPYGDSLILAGIQAFLSVKSCAVFLYFGRKYGKLLEDEVGLIISEEQNEDTSIVDIDNDVSWDAILCLLGYIMFTLRGCNTHKAFVFQTSQIMGYHAFSNSGTIYCA